MNLIKTHPAMKMNKNTIFVAICVIAVVALAIFLGRTSTNDVRVLITAEALAEARVKMEKNGQPKEQKQLVEGKGRFGFHTLENANRDDDVQLDELLAEIATEDEQQLIHAMLNANRLETQDQLKFAAEALKTVKDPDFRLDALGLVERLSNKGVIPILELAAQDSDPNVRKNAISALLNFDYSRDEELQEQIEASEEELDGIVADNDEQKDEALQELYDQILTVEDTNRLAEILLGALNDTDADVRDEAMSIIEAMGADIQYVALEAALNSQYEENKLEALRLLSTCYNKDNFELILQAVNSPEEGVSDRAFGMVEHILGQSFNSGAEAQQWWQQNSHKFGYEMDELQQDTMEPTEEESETVTPAE